MHDRLLGALRSICSVRLVAALRDERLGFPDSKDLRIFIPDVHLISDKRRIEGNFTFSTNHTDLLTALALALSDLRSHAAGDEIIAIYQLGDFLDLWRETINLDDQVDVAAQIKDDHEDLVSALMERKLKTRFLLGNHDFELYRWPDYSAWDRRYFLPDTTAQAPSTIVLHGDIFDWVENLPDAVKAVFVYLFAPHLSPNDYALGQMRALIKKSHRGRNYRTYIQAQKPAPIGVLQDGEVVPDRWNIQQQGSAPEENLRFLEEACNCCMEANRSYRMNLRVAVIGHTHHARIAVKETPAGEFFTLIDCGAWIEQCIASGETDPMPSAQIAALSANEARIYQLTPR